MLSAFSNLLIPLFQNFNPFSSVPRLAHAKALKQAVMVKVAENRIIDLDVLPEHGAGDVVAQAKKMADNPKFVLSPLFLSHNLLRSAYLVVSLLHVPVRFVWLS